MQLVLRCSLWSFPALGRVQVRGEFSKLHFLPNIRYLAIICWMDIFGSSLVEDSLTRDSGCWLIYFLSCVPKKYTRLHRHFKKLQKKLSFAIWNKNKLVHSFLHFVLSNRTCQHFLVRVSKSFCCNWEMLESVIGGTFGFHWMVMTWIGLHLCLLRVGDQGNTFMLNLCVFLLCFFFFSCQFQEISVVFRFSQFYVNATKFLREK